MNPIIPIVVIIICLIGGGITLVYLKTDKKKAKETINKEQKTANDFVNVKEIKDRFLYTRDGQIIMYIKINPISIDLLSEREKKQLCKTLTAELSSEQKPFKFLAVSRPVDISPLINEYTQIISSTSDQKQKDLLRNEMLVMSNYALSGDVVERQFYIMLWEKYEDGIERDMTRRCYEFVSKFESGNIRCEILKEQDIVRLCNLVNNPAYANVEDTEFEATIPIL
ncbi:hypothetical protein [Clostridium manihotivorum]|uniref:Uncharacterized protein n=1 Tax=Clostridium manihotivorum TaxID=2320868 RepID=A0A410DUV9_9CLOT|nr:hypothetical protein [Clostridium manihotivorum]QAA32752.1 hypothetical protein C1I91_14510 [Clostridium manihotivorum]